VQAWWTNNIQGEEFPTFFSSYMTVCFNPTEHDYALHCEEPGVDLGFWESHLDTDYDIDEI